MLALGFALSAIHITVFGFLALSGGGSFAGFSYSLAYGFIAFAIAGFAEQIIWSGYIQTRLIAYSGKLKGFVVTWLFYVFWGFPSRYYLYSGVVVEALAGAVLVFPIGLLFGYIMLRSQNIVPSSIYHLFLNWNALLWLIP